MKYPLLFLQCSNSEHQFGCHLTFSTTSLNFENIHSTDFSHVTTLWDRILRASDRRCQTGSVAYLPANILYLLRILQDMPVMCSSHCKSSLNVTPRYVVLGTFDKTPPPKEYKCGGWFFLVGNGHNVTLGSIKMHAPGEWPMMKFPQVPLYSMMVIRCSDCSIQQTVIRNEANLGCHIVWQFTGVY